MKPAVITCTAIAAFVLVSASAEVRSVGLSTSSERAISSDSRDAGAPVLQRKGRYKKEGDNCVWDVNDSGPNQCTPLTRGRFKKGGNDSCTWDANDSGPDQCTPPQGRWKKAGSRCVWDAKDSGPNQCNPRQPRK
jgi:hypothetical protein